MRKWLKFYLISILLVSIPHFVIGQVSERIVVSKILIKGNQRTKASVINREVVIKQGDLLSQKELEERISESKVNLTKTLLFNFVDISSKIIDSSRVEVEISLQERWYYIPRFRMKSIEQNFNTWIENADFNHLYIAGIITDENFRGMNEKLTLKGSIGFNKSLGIQYFTPNLLPKYHIGFGFGFQWTSNNEATYGLFDYKQHYYRDPSNSIFSQYSTSISLYYRPTLQVDELLTISYNQFQVNDTLIRLNSNYYPYTKMSMLRLFSKTKFDFRNNKIYPLQGTYFDLIIDKEIEAKSTLNPVDFTSITINGRYFYKLFPKWYSAYGVSASTSKSSDNAQMFEQKIGQTGLEVRSFEYDLIPFNSAIIGRAALKYQLVNQPKRSIKFLGNPKFGEYFYSIYANIFADGAFVDFDRVANFEQTFRFTNQWLSSVGVGLDLTTYYDIVLRTEYSYNFAFQKWNFFIHFKASI